MQPLLPRLDGVLLGPKADPEHLSPYTPYIRGHACQRAPETEDRKLGSEPDFCRHEATRRNLPLGRITLINALGCAEPCTFAHQEAGYEQIRSRSYCWQPTGVEAHDEELGLSLRNDDNERTLIHRIPRLRDAKANLEDGTA